jgi:hypothetical protein
MRHDLQVNYDLHMHFTNFGIKEQALQQVYQL